MQLIGFATQFYTLWDYHTEDVYATINGKHYKVGVRHIYRYMKNVSKSLDKVKETYPDLTIDEDLRGKTQSWERTEKIDYPHDVFPFGKLQGMFIAESNDVWQLTRTFDSDSNPRRRVIARRRLIELGELVAFKWTDDSKCNFYSDQDRPMVTCLVPRSFATKEQVARYELQQLRAQQCDASTHHHNNGEKVELELKCLESFGYESMYGYITILKCFDPKGNEYVYQGSSAPSISKEEFTKIKCTIKHGEYKGMKQTYIQRVKIINNN